MKIYNIKKFLFLCALLILSTLNFSAQVNIGMTTPASKGALVQIKEKEPAAGDNSTVINGGLMLPRVNLEKKTSLEPCVSLSEPDYEKQKLKNVGNIVYNLTESNAEDLSEGVYMWNGAEWQYIISQASDFDLDISPKEIIIASGLQGQVIQDNTITITWKPTTTSCALEKVDILNEGIEIGTLPTSLSGGIATVEIPATSIVPLLQSDIDVEQFYEKQSVINFSVSNGTETKIEKLSLRQLHYSLVVSDLEKDVELGGKYKAKIISNGDWKVTVSNPNIITNHTQSGVANILGTEFDFTISDDDKYEGQTATITFSSVNGRFADQTYTVKTFREYPNSYMVKPGSEFQIPIRKAYNVWDEEFGVNLSGVQTAELLWQDKQSLITSLSLEKPTEGINAFIKVKTTTATTTDRLCHYENLNGVQTEVCNDITIPTMGNAVIALKIDGKICWSWHLWITDYDPTTALEHEFVENASDSLAVTNGLVYSYFNTRKSTVIMDRNIGSLTNNPESHYVRGVVYQWGRKDPQPSLIESRSKCVLRPIYDIHNTLLKENAWGSATENGWQLETVTTDITNYLQTTIEKPMTHYAGVAINDADWYSAFNGVHRNDLWTSVKGTKTSFDPCPKGWRVPEGGYGAQSIWYNLPPGGRRHVTPYTEGWDYRPEGFGLLIDEADRKTSAAVYRSSVAWHGRAVGALAYETNFGETMVNTSYPNKRTTTHGMRCVKDEK